VARTHYVGGARNPHKPKVRSKKPRGHQYAVSLERTIALRERLRGSDLLPLFDHLLALAEEDHRESSKAGHAEWRARRAGMALAKARKLAEKHGKS
jgi:hypothetical protein